MWGFVRAEFVLQSKTGPHSPGNALNVSFFKNSNKISNYVSTWIKLTKYVYRGIVQEYLKFEVNRSNGLEMVDDQSRVRVQKDP